MLHSAGRYFDSFWFKLVGGVGSEHVLVTLSAVFISVVLCMAPPAWGQVITGDLTGQVTDTTGAVVPNATVLILNTGTGSRRTLTSNDSGEFTAAQLELGTYSVEVSATGFEKTTLTSIKVSAGDRLRVSPKLNVGSSNETVEVDANTSGTLQTDNSTVSSTIDTKQTEDIPLNGRNFANLAQIQPGTNPGPPTSSSSGSRPDDRRQSTSVSANGQSETANNFTLDGLDMNDRFEGLVAVRPSLDAIQEITVATNLYTAEVGRTAGAVITLLTKAGTNQFHGSAYEFFRNNITDARNYFATPAAVPEKPELHQNQFGGSIGGPIIKDRTFFFGDFEAFRQIDATGTVYTATVPTLFEEQNIGNFSDQGGPVLASTQLNSTAVSYFKLYPAPINSALSNNFVSDPARRQNSETFDVRVDHHFSPTNLFFARYSFNDAKTFTPGPFPAVGNVQPNGITGGNFPGNSKELAQNAQLNYTHIYNSAFLLELKAGYTRFGNQALPLNYGTNFNETAPYFINNANNAPYASGLAPISTTGYSPIGDANANPIFVQENTYQYATVLSYTKGNHTLKVGAAFIRRQASDFIAAFPKGYYIFNQGASAFPTSTASGTIKNLASLLEGGPYILMRNQLLIDPQYRASEPSFFLQDDWRTTPKLTLNLGLRYDVFTAETEKHGNISNLNLVTGTLVQGGQAGVQTQYTNVAPRAGFAYNAFSKTVVRGGFGLSFFPADQTNALILTNPPYSYNSGTIRETSLANGAPSPVAPSTTALSGGLYTKAFDFRTGYIEQFNLNVEQEIGKTVLNVGYVGELGRHLLQTIGNLDVPAPSPVGEAPGTAQATPPYAALLPNVNTITAYEPGGESSYHALQTSVQRRFSRGLTANVNYTYAHILDDAGTDQGIGSNAEQFGLAPPLIKTYDYGNSDLDVRHRLAGSATYAFASPKDGKYKRLLLGGWQGNMLGFWQTGLPFTVSSASAQVNLPTITADRPNVNRKAVNTGGPLSEFFNISAFTAQPYGTLGNENRNEFFGPRLRRLDLSLFKNFPLYRETSLQFRTEVFNVTNTASFAAPNSSISSYSGPSSASGGAVATSAGGFGSITSTAVNFSPRQVQFAIKILF